MRRAALLLALAACAGEEAPDAGVAEDAAAQDAAADDATAQDAAPEDAAPEDAGLGPVHVNVASTDAPRLLSDFRFFTYREGVLEYNAGVVPYELNNALFADYTVKSRAIYVPPGETITYVEDGVLDFPVGTAVVKSFLIAPDLRVPDRDLRIIETRVIIRYPDRWRAFPYLWRDDLSDADYHVRGATVAFSLIDPFGRARDASYLVPQRNQCADCHDPSRRGSEIELLGPKARYLNRDAGGANQLQHLASRGLLAGLPDLASVPRARDFAPFAATGTAGLSYAELEQGAREYLDVNCGHCHRPEAVHGTTSQLFLDLATDDPFHLGVCKEPGSAGGGAGGLRYDIVPGDPDRSILAYRTETETLGEMMPLIGRSLADTRGVAFVRAWIAGMPARACE